MKFIYITTCGYRLLSHCYISFHCVTRPQLFSHLTVYGHLGIFQVFIIMTHVAMNILYKHVGISVGYIPRVGIVRCQGVHMFHFGRYSKILSQSGCTYIIVFECEK